MQLELNEKQINLVNKFGCAGTPMVPTEAQGCDFAGKVLDFALHHIPQLEGMGFDRMYTLPVSSPLTDSPPTDSVSTDIQTKSEESNEEEKTQALTKEQKKEAAKKRKAAKAKAKRLAKKQAKEDSKS